MSKNNHCGKMKERNSRNNTRCYNLGNYIIFTDTKCTEKNYIDGLYENLSEKLREHLLIRTFKTRTEKLVEECKNKTSLEPQFAEPWIVFDRDQVQNFDEIIDEALRKGINVGWSNPCIESWFEAYFGKMNSYISSKKCCEHFAEQYKKKTGKVYSKSDKQIYSILNKYGNQNKAIELAETCLKNHKNANRNLPSEMIPSTTLHKLIKNIVNKTIIDY